MSRTDLGGVLAEFRAKLLDAQTLPNLNSKPCLAEKLNVTSSGNVPSFVISLGKKAGKQKPIEWVWFSVLVPLHGSIPLGCTLETRLEAQKLQEHCRRKALVGNSAWHLPM